MFTALPGQEKLSAPRLMADDVGPCVFPAIQANDPEFGQIDRSPPMSERTRRMSLEGMEQQIGSNTLTVNRESVETSEYILIHVEAPNDLHTGGSDRSGPEKPDQKTNKPS